MAENKVFTFKSDMVGFGRSFGNFLSIFTKLDWP